MIYLTDFADGAVLLPVIAVVAALIALLGWWRGALAWLLSASLSLMAVLTLKVIFLVFGPLLGVSTLISPSGHTAAAALMAGGLAALMGSRRDVVLTFSGVGAALIGTSRVALLMHSLSDVLMGGSLGLAGALIFSRVAGRPPPPRRRLGWVFTAVIGISLLQHGHHLNTEPRIRAVAVELQSYFQD